MFDWLVGRRGGYGGARSSVLVWCGLLSAAAAVPAWAGTPAGTPMDSRAETEAIARYKAELTAGSSSRDLSSLALNMHGNSAIPAFARKYGLPCSACHTAWPELNPFGQKFKDNGYQLGNDRDSPIWSNPSYFPIAIRTTPNWRYERTTNQPVDATPGDGTSGTAERTITQAGFDISGADILMLGTLYKNITFGFVPTVEDGEGVGIETAFVRLDNLFQSTWANFKVGKFELDNMLSEKRAMMLSSGGAFYQSYHFLPVGSVNDFGLGDNQIGAEWMGHSANSYSRVAVAALGTVDGVPGIASGKSYDFSLNASQGFDAGSLGLERIGVFAYLGRRPTVFETVGGEPIPGTGTNNKAFNRFGAVADLFFGKFELIPLYMHATEDAALGGGTQKAVWNSGLAEAHYYVSPQLVFTGRAEMLRMSQQADPTLPDNMGNINAYTLGYRWYPIMFSRAGLAMVGEVSFTKNIGTAPLSGIGAGVDPLTPTTPVNGTSVLLALDFDF